MDGLHPDIIVFDLFKPQALLALFSAQKKMVLFSDSTTFCFFKLETKKINRAFQQRRLCCSTFPFTVDRSTAQTADSPGSRIIRRMTELRLGPHMLKQPQFTDGCWSGGELGLVIVFKKHTFNGCHGRIFISWSNL